MQRIDQIILNLLDFFLILTANFPGLMKKTNLFHTFQFHGRAGTNNLNEPKKILFKVNTNKNKQNFASFTHYSKILKDGWAKYIPIFAFK